MEMEVKFKPYTELDFSQIEKRAKHLADHIESCKEELFNVLLQYESFEVAEDETARALDILKNLHENKEFFKLRIGAVTSFLPRNQPLYALTCFVIVPSLMASEVHFRIPNSMRNFFPDLLSLLSINQLFPNVIVSNSTRSEFLKERTALRIDPSTKKTLPVTDVVIFTGTPVHADQLRFVFDQKTLFISNGSGHNPVVVGSDADLKKAAEAVLTLQLYNQGQDCAAPNTILVHKDVFNNFLHIIRDELRTVGVGDYRDRSCRVGAISDPDDLVRIQEVLINHREWIDPTTPGIIRAHDAIVEPTIICKPLIEGGNYKEIFAPVIILQEYDEDNSLAQYFENESYAENAMYVTLYGSSEYVENLIGREINGLILHRKESFIHNTHLHAPGIERGTQPYGGNGYGASSLSINGQIICKATLPQRDIYEHIALPILEGVEKERGVTTLDKYTGLKQKNVDKLLRLKNHVAQVEMRPTTSTSYIDLSMTKISGERFLKIDDEYAYHLLESPNLDFIATLTPMELEAIRALRTLIQRKASMTVDEFNFLLYVLSKSSHDAESDDQSYQKHFFQQIYQLLLGKTSGPRLSQFLWEIDGQKVCELLNV